MEENSFDFVEFAYDRLVKNFHNHALVGRTIPMKSIYRFCGLLFSLNKHQTRYLPQRDLSIELKVPQSFVEEWVSEAKDWCAQEKEECAKVAGIFVGNVIKTVAGQ